MRHYVIYVAGKFRGATAWDIERNIREAEEVGYRLAELGFAPLIPHTNTRFFHGTCTEQFWLDATLELLRRCDAVCTVPNWKDSTGAKREVEEARKLRLPVFHRPIEVLAKQDRILYRGNPISYNQKKE